ncbi:luciferase family protein [Nocardia abscessus]|uniref:Phospholipase n=1 Tax=Nocardia abscessus TaxID=120957 RepID=A0ABS0CIV7_9NOCA|nr:luciferase family protein [Nocardia abscessus]MBF6229457.1 phospholipase [Nocardia abscessus]
MTTTTVAGSLDLPRRCGDRPSTREHNPHQQLSQIAPAELQEELWSRMSGLDDVLLGRSGVSLPDTRAVHLRPTMAQGPDEAYLAGTEFAHLHGHGDGSLHMCLPKDVVAQAVRQGWAEPHPMARQGYLPGTLVMVYGPRDRAELDVVWQLVRISHGFARHAATA